MISEGVHIPITIQQTDSDALKKGTWLVLLHAKRIPPHIGLMFNGNYNSLTIKEHEINISFEALHKTIIQKKIKSIFIRVVPHPVFSIDHQLAMFQEILKKYPFVKQNEASCLSPIKQFFNEFYALQSTEDELLHGFVQKLFENSFISVACKLNMDDEEIIELPYYTKEELNEKIKNERQPYYND